jgi:3-oxoacyl-[acyl-carrier-protein] synthase-1
VADYVLAGGVDSFRDLFILGTLDAEQRVKSEDNLDGFVPGEGAAFLLLASAAAVIRNNLQPLAHVSDVAMGFEKGHLYSSEPYRGDGLSTTLTQAFASGASSAPIAEVFSSMNGESHWAKEWGVSFLRNRNWFGPELRLHHPAEFVGDVGAAFGAVAVALAAHGMRGYYRRSPTMVIGSSDRGQRAAVVVTAD